jgi:hypothetical protein
LSHQGDRKGQGIGDTSLEACRLDEVFCRKPVAVVADEVPPDTSHGGGMYFATERTGKFFRYIQVDEVLPAHQAPTFHIQE